VRAEECVSAAASRLAAASIPHARREARLLVAIALGCDPAQIVADPGAELDVATAGRLDAFVERRLAHEPLSRIRGYREFWSLRFEVSADTLDPRPDSETLIEAALAALPDRTRRYRLLDLGVGTGCLLLALLSELHKSIGFGVDCFSGAVAVARRNAAELGLTARATVVPGEWECGLEPGFDVILANPPYIRTDEIATLMPEVAGFDPRPALDGGADGLAAYRRLAPEIARLLGGDGIAVVELGVGQRAAVSQLMTGVGLVIQGTRHDLSGVERCLVLGRS